PTSASITHAVARERAHAMTLVTFAPPARDAAAAARAKGPRHSLPSHRARRAALRAPCGHATGWPSLTKSAVTRSSAVLLLLEGVTSGRRRPPCPWHVSSLLRELFWLVQLDEVSRRIVQECLMARAAHVVDGVDGVARRADVGDGLLEIVDPYRE